ncbi:MAG: MATE family efflux transporter [Candidatus Krumholzibacteriia bacterium]
MTGEAGPTPRITPTFPADEQPGSAAWAASSESDITHGPLDRALVRLAGPAILAKALYAVLALVDVFWVGRLGAASTAAVNTAFFTSWILDASTSLPGIGILAHVSRAVGARDRRLAGLAAAQGIGVGVGLGGVLALAVWFGAPALFDILGTSDEVRAPGIAYLRVLYLAAPLTFTYINCEAVMRAAGDTRTPLLIIGSMVLLNAVLDPVLIFGLGPFPQLGVFGAGLATAIAQLFAVAIFAWRALVRDVHFPLLRGSLRRLDAHLAASVMRVGMPGMAIGVLFSLVYLFLSGVAARMGTVELAILGLGTRAETFTYLVGTGFGAATAAMVGQNLGAGQPERAARAAWRSALWMGMYGASTGLVLIVWPRVVLGLFTADPEVLGIGATYLRILGLCQALMAIELVFANAFAGAGDTVPPMLISVPVNLLRVPLVFWVVYGLDSGILGIAWILSIGSVVRGVLAPLWFRRGRWKQKQL